MRLLRRAGWLSCLVLTLLAGGCAATAPSIFENVDGPVWPATGEPPRIRYLGSVSMPEDLQIQQNLLARIWHYVIGGAERNLKAPQAVTVAGDGSLVVADAGTRTIKVYNRAENRFNILPDDDHLLQKPVGVAVDSEAQRIYVSDSAAGLIRFFPLKGPGVSGELGKGQLERPTGLAISPVTNELLVLDAKQSALLRYSRGDHTLKGRVGMRGTDPGQFNHPTDLALNSSGEILVSDALNFRVQIFSPAGEFRRAFGKAGDSPGYFSRPKGIAVDSEDHIYVVDTLFDNVQVFDREGQLLIAFGSAGQQPGQFWMPAGISIDKNDRIYVADTYNRRIQIFQYLKTAERK